MSTAFRTTIKRSVYLGFALVTLAAGCSSDDKSGGGGAAGSVAHATAGSANGGSSGASAGGAPGASGASGSSASAGKGGGCDIPECLVANTCLNHCGGNVVYTGCCACLPPAVNRNTCAEQK